MLITEQIDELHAGGTCNLISKRQSRQRSFVTKAAVWAPLDAIIIFNSRFFILHTKRIKNLTGSCLLCHNITFFRQFHSLLALLPDESIARELKFMLL